MVLYARTGQVTIMIVCPHCKFGSRYGSSFIEDAIHDHKKIVCIVCNEKFEIVARLPDSDSDEQNEVVDVIPDIPPQCVHDFWPHNNGDKFYEICVRCGECRDYIKSGNPYPNH